MANLRKVLNTDVFYGDIATKFIADAINSKTCTAVVSGGAATTTVAIDNAANSPVIISMTAFNAAAGTPASKILLSSGTDYTISGNTITWVTNQSGNNVVIHYTVA